MARLSIDSVSKRFDASSVMAVDDVSLTVEGSELVALLGPSGCGKTTLLRMIAGFLPVTSGRIQIGSKDVTQTPPHRRDTGMVFQSYALFPHMTVAENVAFGLEMRKVAAPDRKRQVAEALQLVHLENFGDRYPRQLSGGQQQRVAIARALAVRPGVFLLDEPLSNLDAKLRQSVGLEIRALQKSLGLTTVFVTHDQTEALALADRLVLMNGGRVEQIGTAAELYTNPANVFVASFLGQANLMPGRVTDKGRFAADIGISVPCDTSGFETGSRGTLCVRPEAVDILDTADGANALTGDVERITYLGSITEIEIRASGRTEPILVHLQNRGAPSAGLSVGARCAVGWKDTAAKLLAEQLS
ncbi:MAG TPA: ABC transporter ATP-binding protein [Pseudolabrys sp.]|nr:ABC transporter ATP-binding protein [Pseudolabrys sp.]